MHVDNAHNKTTNQGKPKVRPAQIRNITDMKSMYPQQFDKFRNFAGTAKLHHKLMPHKSAACTTKTSWSDNLTAGCHNMWYVSSMNTKTGVQIYLSLPTTKKVRLDPKRINDGLRRCPPKIPTVEELNSELANVTVFSMFRDKSRLLGDTSWWRVTINDILLNTVLLLLLHFDWALIMIY